MSETKAVKPVLKIVNLQLERDKKSVIRGLDLEVGRGEIHILMGKNGSGKSTAALSVMGYPGIEVISGKIVFNGKNINKMSSIDRFKSGIFLAFQNPPMIEGLTVNTLIRRSISSLGVLSPIAETKKRLLPFLPLLKIDESFLEKQVNKDMSGGEKKKSEILQLIAADPKIAILDEIDSGADIPTIKQFGKVLNALKKKGTSFIIITHYEKLIKYLSPDHIHILNGGKIVFSGDTKGQSGILKKIEKEGFDSFNEKRTE